MSVRAKFKVEKIERTLGSINKVVDGRQTWNTGEVHTITLQPVVKGSPENDKFFAATPGGEIKLYCTSLDASEQFELGKEYYIDFTQAEKIGG